jgi:cysteinyl-tRNA synthetase
LAELKSLARSLNFAHASGRGEEADMLAAELRTLGRVLGLLQVDPEEWLKKPVPDRTFGAGSVVTVEASIDEMIAKRIAARKAKDFKEADRIRDELLKAGVVLEDTPDGATTWRRK